MKSERHLSLATEEELLGRYARERSESLRSELVERFLPLARTLAGRYSNRAEPMDDLVQVASMGLVKALDRFDPEMGNVFSTFAVPTILGELRRHFRDHTWDVRVPRGLKDRVLQVEKALENMPPAEREQTTVSLLSERLGATEEEVLEAIMASRTRYSKSFDESPVREDGEALSLLERTGEVDSGFAIAEETVDIREAMATLSQRDRDILRMRYVEDMTQREIADKVGVSQMQVSRLLRRIVESIREEMDVEDLEAAGVA